MKILTTLMGMALALACNASASTIFCGNFSYSNAPYLATPFTQTGSISCPGLGDIGSLATFSASVLLTTDFTGGDPGPDFPVTAQTNSVETQYSSSVFVFPVNTTYDTLTTSGSPDSSNHNDTDGLTPSGVYFLGATNLTALEAEVSGTAFTVDYSTAEGGATAPGAASPTVGQTQGLSGQVYVVYNYTVAPEPVSMLLLGSGLIAISLIGRRKFGRR